MSRERKYQQGKFENYYPERNMIQEEDIIGRSTGTDHEVRRRGATEVGGTPDPESRPRPLHRGKGPRNYQRRDERILEEMNDRLCDNPYIDASEIDVSVSDGDVVLSGSVEDRDSKRLAEDIGDSISGVKNVENRLRVKMRGI
jgi:osmotically-inducible protein OsmY